jgi:hypothetical protein
MSTCEVQVSRYLANRDPALSPAKGSKDFLKIGRPQLSGVEQFQRFPCNNAEKSSALLIEVASHPSPTDIRDFNSTEIKTCCRFLA